MKDKSRVGFQSVVIVLLLIVIVFLALIVLRGIGTQPVTPAQSVSQADRESGRIGYASEGVTIATDENALQDAVDAMEEGTEGVEIEYRVSAFSEDGTNFSCYIGNPAASKYDKFIAIYADAALEEELFVSGLLKPGQIFEKVTLNRKLEESQMLFVTFNDVDEDEDGNQVLVGQVVMGVTFNII